MINHVNVGLYRLGTAETPQEVSQKVYNDVHRYPALLQANPDSDWNVGDIIRVPNKQGRTSVVEEGESTTEFIARMYKGHMGHLFLEKYLLWNAGVLAEHLVGQEVFIPDR